MEKQEAALQKKLRVVFRGWHNYPIPTNDDRLVLIDRSGRAPGFLVYVKSADRGGTATALLIGVAFNVPASKSLNDEQSTFNMNPLTLKSARIGTNHT